MAETAVIILEPKTYDPSTAAITETQHDLTSVTPESICTPESEATETALPQDSAEKAMPAEAEAVSLEGLREADIDNEKPQSEAQAREIEQSQEEMLPVSEDFATAIYKEAEIEVEAEEDAQEPLVAAITSLEVVEERSHETPEEIHSKYEDEEVALPASGDVSVFSHQEELHEEPAHEELVIEETTLEDEKEAATEQENIELHNEAVLPTTEKGIPSIAIHTPAMTENELHDAAAVQAEAPINETLSKDATQEISITVDADKHVMDESSEVDEVREAPEVTEVSKVSWGSEQVLSVEVDDIQQDAVIDSSTTETVEESAHTAPSPTEVTLAAVALSLDHEDDLENHIQDTREDDQEAVQVDVHEQSLGRVPLLETVHEGLSNDSVLHDTVMEADEHVEVLPKPVIEHTRAEGDTVPGISGQADAVQEYADYETTHPETAHGPESELHEQAARQVESLAGGLMEQTEQLEQTNSAELHGQEPSVAIETYTIPYESSHYASPNPSPLPHESFNKQAIQSLDEELGGVFSDWDETEEGIHGTTAQAEHLADARLNVQEDKEHSPEAESPAPMHGQDHFLNDDSEEAAGFVTVIDYADEEQALNVEHTAEAEHIPEDMDMGVLHPRNADIPQTPTTVIGVSHEADNNTSLDETSRLDVDHHPVTPDASTPVASHFESLSNNRDASQSEPVTPPGQTPTVSHYQDKILGEAAFVPRDVTHVPWRERSSISSNSNSNSIDATPGSVRSEATLSTMSDSPPANNSNASSPWAAAIESTGAAPDIGSLAGRRALVGHQDNLFIRSSWSGTPSVHGQGSSFELEDEKRLILGRQLDYYNNNNSGDDGPVLDAEKTALALDAMQQPSFLSGPKSDSGRPNSIASSSPSSLFKRMRSIFEPPNGAASETDTDATASSHDLSPSTGHPVEGELPLRKTTQQDTNKDNDDDDDLNERSSLLPAAPAVGVSSY